MTTNINCLQLFSNFPVTFSQTWCLFTKTTPVVRETPLNKKDYISVVFL